MAASKGGPKMPKRLFVLDADHCVGCQLCVFACARRPGVAGLAGTGIWVRSAGGIRKGFVVVACRACADPSCARVCPVDALEIRPEGACVCTRSSASAAATARRVPVWRGDLG